VSDPQDRGARRGKASKESGKHISFFLSSVCERLDYEWFYEFREILSFLPQIAMDGDHSPDQCSLPEKVLPVKLVAP
jgi:hypothetical protein